MRPPRRPRWGSRESPVVNSAQNGGGRPGSGTVSAAAVGGGGGEWDGGAAGAAASAAPLLCAGGGERCAVRLWGARSGSGSTRACSTRSPFPVVARSLAPPHLRGCRPRRAPGRCSAESSPLSGRLPLPLSLSRPRRAALAAAAVTTRGNGRRIDGCTRSLAVVRWAGAAARGTLCGRGRAP